MREVQIFSDGGERLGQLILGLRQSKMVNIIYWKLMMMIMNKAESKLKMFAISYTNIWPHFIFIISIAVKKQDKV